MTNQFHKLLLSELHMVVYQPGNLSTLNDRLLCEAVTLNENLQSLGFVMKPDALMQLAISPSLHTFFKDVKALVPEVNAQPMYPGFPQQVMEMSEAEFRMHQMMHYFSTYGLEELFGVRVNKGWLPAYRGPARTQEDSILLEARVLDLVAEADAPLHTLSVLLARRERLTNPELDLTVEAASLCTAEQMQNLTVRFKENLELLFPKLLEDADRDTALRTLRCICSHSGDVLRCTAAYLSRRRYHLRTSEKKLLVKLLESYPVWNFRQNLMQSNSLRERNLMILQYLDYNRYSRSPEHLETVRALRNSELLSWNGIGEELLQKHSPKALVHLAQRPGYMLRMLNRLLSLGYSKDDILEILLPKAASISSTLVLNTLQVLNSRVKEVDWVYAFNRKRILQNYTWEVNCCSEDYLTDRYQLAQQSCHSSYRYSMERYSQKLLDQDYKHRERNCRDNNRWRSQHYSQETIAYLYRKQKEDTLHTMSSKRHKVADQYLNLPQKNARKTATLMVQPIKAQLNALQKEYSEKSSAIVKRWPQLKSLIQYIRAENGLHSESDLDILLHYYPWYCKTNTDLRPLKEKILFLQETLEREQQKADAWLDQELRKLEVSTADAYASALAKIDEEEQDLLLALELEYHQNLLDAAVIRNTLPMELENELEQLKQDYLKQCQDATLARQELTRQRDEDLAKLEEEYRHNLATASEQLKNAKIRCESELALLEESHQESLSKCRNDILAVGILTELLREHFRQVVTPLQGKKVFCDLKQFDLEHSSLETGKRSKDGGYIRSGISWKIPDNAKYVRFFVYWNDPERVDIDLHAGGTMLSGDHLHVGWNADFRNSGVVHSGDITHSDAAEYIDIDLSTPIREISANVSLFSGKRGFQDIATCYVGLMAVDQIGQCVKHYSPKNCFFTHELTQSCRNLFYGFVDVQNRCVRFVGQPNQNDMDWAGRPQVDDSFSLQDYLDCVLDGQQVQIVDSAEDADVILSMGKSLSKKGVSLVDSNFFLEC